MTLDPSPGPSEDPPPRLLALGLDALPPVVLDDCLREGALPNLAALIAGGRRGLVESQALHFPAGVWPTFFTMSGVASHGVHHLLQWDAETQTLRAVGSDFCKVTPFWHRLAEAGIPVISLDVPFSDSGSSPPGAVEVVGWGMHEGVWRASRPAGLLRDLERRHGTCALPREGPGERSEEVISAELPLLASDVVRRVGIIEDMATRFDWRFFICTFSEVHRAGHWYWDESRTGVAQGGLKLVLRILDALLPRLRRLLRPQDHLALFSVHGMDRTQDVDRAGYASVNFLRAGQSGAGGFDPVLALREALPLGVSRSVARMLPQALYNWAYYRLQNSRARRSSSPWVAHPLDHIVLFYLRENGLSEKARESVLATLEGVLGKMLTRDGRQVYDSFYRPKEELSGPRVSYLPDLIAAPGQKLIGPEIRMPDGSLRTAPRLSSRDGEHSAQGLYIQAGPGIAPGTQGPSVQGEDLARFLCAPAGLPV